MKNKGSSTFDELKRQLKNLEKDIQVKRYDYSSNETNKAISKTLDAEFTHRTHLFRTFGKGKNFRKQMIGTILFSSAENKRCAI